MVIYHLLLDTYISRIRCQRFSLCERTKKLNNKRNDNETLPKNMLESLVKKLVTVVMISVLANMEFQLYHLHLDQCFMNKKQQNNF